MSSSICVPRDLNKAKQLYNCLPLHHVCFISVYICVCVCVFVTVVFKHVFCTSLM